MTMTRPRNEVPMPRKKPPITINRGRDTIRRLTAQRTETRDARQYAEQWYQTLRTWDVHFPDVLPKISYAAFRDQGAYDPLTMGEGGPPQKTYLRTPAGEVSETEVGQIISDMTLSTMPDTVLLGRMLDRLRRHDNGCMAALLRPDGRWERNREAAMRYALAVLTLAVRLGDVHAERPRQLIERDLYQLTNVTC
ncbi:hypothetical protein GCM10010842_32440 [Deinococcus daejeonensis]|uniref:Uncharacterized protein n=2 Tax=Deinococcus daejeonensis TaxID=1007098 RepID=A0ABQ2JBI0_9DEIO|nr:hypothetical protein GCM10010842_32440 [Deinococcus daejeonensis]